jgi:hypothetical protein
MAKERSVLPAMPKEQYEHLLAKAQERSKARDAERAREKERSAGNALGRYAERVARRRGLIHDPLHKQILDHYGSGGTYEDAIPEKTMKELNKWRKKWNGSPLGRTSAANWLRSIIDKNPNSKLTIYNWIEANEPDALTEGQWETVKKFRELNDLAKNDELHSNGETTADIEAAGSDWMDTDSYKLEQSLANKNRSIIDDTRETIASKEREKDAAARERWRKQDEAAIPSILPAPKPDLGPIEDDTQSLVDAYTPWAEKSKALIDEAKKYGFKGDLERQITAGYDREFKANGGDGEKAFDTLRNNLYKAANKKAMAQRGAQMNADQKAREDAARDNPNAEKRRNFLIRTWNGGGLPTERQMMVKARWDAERKALDGSKGKFGAAEKMKGFEGSDQHIAATATLMNKTYGDKVDTFANPNGWTHQFNQALKYQQGLRNALLEREKALAEEQKTRTKNLTTAGVAVANGDTSPEDAAIAFDRAEKKTTTPVVP